MVDLKNNKIGAQAVGMSGKSFGVKRKFFGFGEAKPTVDLTIENLDGVKKLLSI